MREFAVPFVLVAFGLLVYLRIMNLLGEYTLAMMVLLCGALSIVMYIAPDLTEFGVKTRLGELVARVERARADVFAKAEAVKAIAEDVAATSALTLSRLGRLPESTNEVDELLEKERDRLTEMLQRAGTSPDRVAEITRPMNEAIRNDLAGEVIDAAREAVRAKYAPVTTSEKATAVTTESEELLRLHDRLLQSPIGEADQIARRELEPKALWTDAVAKAVARLEEFRRTGQLPAA